MTFNIGLSNDFHNLRKQILFEKPDIIQLQEVSSHIQKQLKFLVQEKTLKMKKILSFLIKNFFMKKNLMLI